MQIDTKWLGSWISGQHLEVKKIKDYRRVFESTSVRKVQIEEFVQSDIANSVSNFMKRDSVYKRVFGIYDTNSKGITVSQEKWSKTPVQDRFYTYELLVSAKEKCLSLTPVVFQKLCRALSDPRFVEYFRCLTGLPLSKIDTIRGHSMKYGDYLCPHKDDLGARKLTFIIYMNPLWLDEYGGELVLKHTGGDESIKCLFNSIAIFDIEGQLSHHVNDITYEAGSERRLCLTGWYE